MRSTTGLRCCASEGIAEATSPRMIAGRLWSASWMSPRQSPSAMTMTTPTHWRAVDALETSLVRLGTWALLLCIAGQLLHTVERHGLDFFRNRKPLNFAAPVDQVANDAEKTSLAVAPPFACRSSRSVSKTGPFEK
jgi:hypothetical protein